LAADKKSKQLDMTQGPIASKMFKFCMPIVLTSVLQLLFNAADIIVVGQFVGADAVAAVGSTTFLINLLINFFLGLSIGATVVISTDIGAKRYVDVGRDAHTTVMMGILFGLMVSAVGIMGAHLFLTWMATPADVIGQSTLYLRIYFFGTPCFMIYTFGRAVLITTGDTKRPMYYLFFAGCVNVALNLFLVIEFHLGVAGVAIGTVASQLISAILIINRLRHIEGPCRIILKDLKIYRSKARTIFRMGLPTGLQSVVFAVSNVMIQSSVNSLGTLYVAGNAAASNIEGFVWVSMDAFNQGATTFTGQNYGAGRDERFNKIFASAVWLSTLVGCVMGFTFLIFARPVLGVYLPTSAEAVSRGIYRMMIFMPTYWTCGIMNVATGCVRGMNRPLVPMIATMIGVCLVRIVWIVFGFHAVSDTYGSMMAYISLCVSYPVTWVITGVFLVWYYFHVKKIVTVNLAAAR